MRLRHLLLLVAVLATTLVVPAPAPAGAAPLPPSPLRRPSAGYHLVAADGGVFTFGRAEFHGSAGDIKLNKPIVGMAQTAAGSGYWLVANDGGIFSYGDARFLGSTGDIKLNRPIVGMAATPTGRGYWLVATDGGIFNYGDARFEGSTGSMRLTRPIVGMAATPTGRGYWLVASDGGIFAFGDAGFFGSTGDMVLNKPVVGMAATPTGKGYWLVASDGGLFAFGDAPFFGSTGAMALTRPVVGMTATRFGHGYWLYASDGGIFAFGDAGFHGSTGDIRLNSPIVGMTSPHKAPAVEDVAVFYYAWYATKDYDGAWDHWNSADPGAAGTAPKYAPESGQIASNYYPARGLYSSKDPAAVDAHMADIAGAGVQTVIVSWWGRGSRRNEGDDALPVVAEAARRHGLRLAIHVENYPGRTPADVAAAVPSFRGLGVTDLYLYTADEVGAAAWRQLTDAHPDLRILARGHDPANDRNGNWAAYAQAAGFDGIYTYDANAYTPADFALICALARARALVCSPSVAPGYDARRALLQPGVRDRRRGALYEEMWQGALDAAADMVSITSYNEWHEGTQIEPAQSPPPTGYRDYEGVDYLARTRSWAERAKAPVRG